MSLSLSKRDLIFCEKALMSRALRFRRQTLEITDISDNKILESLEKYYLETHGKVRELIKELEATE